MNNPFRKFKLKLQKNTRRLPLITNAGFIFVLSLMALTAMLSLSGLEDSTQKMTDIVKINNKKTELIGIMKDEIRKRLHSLTYMASIDDVFERDDEIQKFYAYAARFRDARDQLLKLPMNTVERQLHKQITEQTRKGQPVGRRAAQLMREDVSREELTRAVRIAIREQSLTIGLLDKMALNQTQLTYQALRNAKHENSELYFYILLTCMIAWISSVLITRFVVNYVTRQSDLLASKNNELEDGYHKAEQAAEVKSKFLANMSHEIRTPLTAIIGFSEGLKNFNLSDSDRSESINTIIRSSNHLLTIINDILDFSKLEVDKVKIEKLSISPFEIIRDVRSLVALMADEKGLEFEIRFRFPLPEKITSDPVRLKQILINLCNNAIKFTNNGGVKLLVSCKQKTSKMKFSVIDTGIGLTYEQQQTLFEPFTQADSSTTRQFGGTGLGLYLSRTLARQLGGELTVSSKFGFGSTFNVEIDAGDLGNATFVSENPQVRLAVNNTDEDNIEMLSGNVLLAEDNKDNQRLVSMFLRQTGIKPDIADDGQQAIEKALSSNYDLILMDVQMPNTNGLDATRILRKNGYNGYIVALTANAMQSDIETSLAAGCSAHFPKPIIRKDFFRMLANYLPKAGPGSQSSEPITSDILHEDPDLIDLIIAFSNKLPITLANINQIYKEGRISELKDAVHDLKGTAGNFGFPDIFELCKEIEAVIRNRQFTKIHSMLMSLQELSKRIQQGLINSNLSVG